MLITSVVIFASIMTENSEQHQRASSFGPGSKVQICNWL